MPPPRGTALGIKAPASSAVSIAALLARRRRLTPVSGGRRDPRRETECALALRTPVAPSTWTTSPSAGAICTPSPTTRRAGREVGERHLAVDSAPDEARDISPPLDRDLSDAREQLRSPAPDGVEHEKFSDALVGDL